MVSYEKWGCGGHCRKVEQQYKGHELENTWHIGGRYCPEWLEHMREERVLPNVTDNRRDSAHGGLIGHGKESGFYSV